MPPQLPPVVYKCILPIGTSLVASDPSEKTAQTLPYPAWPYIDDPHVPCCLPTLMFARYFEHRSTKTESKKTAAIAKKYLSRREDIEREISEQAQAFVKAQNIFWRHLPKITSHPQILFGPGDMDIIRKAGWFGMEVLEAGMQGLIEGHRDNLYGENEAYAISHEFAHFLTRGLTSGRTLDERSDLAQTSLYLIASKELEHTHEEINTLWAHFWQRNTEIQQLAQKFEPVEEIFATYIGLWLSPPEVRNAVEPLINVELEKRNWKKAYDSLAEFCNYAPFDQAILIYAPVCRMIEQLYFRYFDIDINSVELLCTFLEIKELVWLILEKELELLANSNDFDSFIDSMGWKDALRVEAKVERGIAEQINRILEQARIPQDIYWDVGTEMRHEILPEMFRLYNAIINDDLSDEDRQKLMRLGRIIILIGRPSTKEIELITSHLEQEELTPSMLTTNERILLESIRQQLCWHWYEEGLKFVCPFGYRYRGGCCGANGILLRLYERLPEKDRKRFTLPDCVLTQ